MYSGRRKWEVELSELSDFATRFEELIRKTEEGLLAEWEKEDRRMIVMTPQAGKFTVPYKVPQITQVCIHTTKLVAVFVTERQVDHHDTDAEIQRALFVVDNHLPPRLALSETVRLSAGEPTLTVIRFDGGAVQVRGGGEITLLLL